MIQCLLFDTEESRIDVGKHLDHNFQNPPASIDMVEDLGTVVPARQKTEFSISGKDCITTCDQVFLKLVTVPSFWWE